MLKLTFSKFYGNSTSAILDGAATLSLLPRGEVILIVWNLEVAILKEQLPPIYSLVER